MLGRFHFDWPFEILQLIGSYTCKLTFRTFVRYRSYYITIFLGILSGIKEFIQIALRLLGCLDIGIGTGEHPEHLKVLQITVNITNIYVEFY